MKVLMAAGGTGGHVIPALVVARELTGRDPRCGVLFVGTAKGVENRLVPQAGFPLELVSVGALQGQSAAVLSRNVFRLPRALWQGFQILRKFQPDVVLGVGGYAAGPVMLAAALTGVPLAVLEPNAYPGMANRWVGPYIARAFIAFPEAASFFRSGTAVMTGIPVRKEFFEIKPHVHTHGSDSCPTVLVFGGSQGARSLNRAVVEALPKFAECGKRIRLVHQTGQTEYNAIEEAYKKWPIEAEVLPYIERMPEAFGRADLVVCRAGANTVAELAAAGRAAILVPFPSAANQHQLRNAESVARSGAARLILDRDLNGQTFFSAVREMFETPETIHRMQERVRAFARPDATARIADELEKLGYRL